MRRDFFDWHEPAPAASGGLVWPSLADHFVPASLSGLVRRRHPYDFVETYDALREVYGYELAYVNLGLWDEGEATVEPGQKLAFAVLDALKLEPGGCLIDVGSGLGQAAVDACQRYRLAEVLGVNPNPRQVGFANRLAELAGVAGRVRHEVGDGCTRLGALPAGRYDGISAVECLGHLRSPAGFLAGARHVLRAGGRISFCLNVAARPLGFWLRRTTRLAWGFAPDSLATWVLRLEEAGFLDTVTADITERVLAPVAAIVAARLRAGRGRGLGLTARSFVRWQLHSVSKGVERGYLRYALVAATRP